MKIKIIIAISILAGIWEYSEVNNINLLDNINSQHTEIDTCKNSLIYQFLYDYIETLPRTIDKNGNPTDRVYYYAYLFRTDTNYISVWWSPYSDLSMITKENPNRTFTFRGLKVADCYFTIITDQLFDQEEFLLPVSKCFINVNQVPKPELDVHYDGPSYPRTYKYYKQGDKYAFLKQNQFNIDFLGKERVDWEEYAMKKLRGLYPNASF